MLDAVQKDHLGGDDFGALALLASVGVFPAVGLQPAADIDPAPLVEMVDALDCELPPGGDGVTLGGLTQLVGGVAQSTSRHRA